MAHDTPNGHEHLLQQPLPTTLTIYCDARHGWLSVAYHVLEKLRIAELISVCSYRLEGTVYLEEDEDMGIFLEAYINYMVAHGKTKGFLHIKKVYEHESFVRSLPPYTKGW